jgi:hypothetical protein
MTIDNSFSSDLNVKEILELQYIKSVQRIVKIQPTRCNTIDPGLLSNIIDFFEGCD